MSPSKAVPQGMSLRDARRLARHLGVTVTEVRRTGEIRFRAGGLTVTHNNRRKDASRALVALLRKQAAAAQFADIYANDWEDHP